MHIETFQTERLQLRKFTPEIYNQLFCNFTEVEIRDIIRCASDEEFQKLKAKVEGGLATHNLSFVFFQLVESSTQTVLGGCGFHNWRIDHRRAEIGYHLEKEEFKQRGFMKEAIAFVLNYGFKEINLHRIEALVSPKNVPSLKLVRHFGFQAEGLLKEHYFTNDRFEDSLIFGLLQKNFQR